MSVATLDLVDRGIPRRLSARPGDRFFDQHLVDQLDGKVAVLLDGRELAEVASCDVDKGEVTRICRNAAGFPIFDERGVPAVQTLCGRVEVRRKAAVA